MSIKRFWRKVFVWSKIAVKERAPTKISIDKVSQYSDHPI
ncbi:hypothetical protein OCHUTO_0086 [Orientia chuto str. Dubai]|uniref:Uncharacterized protein n=1 Tax=Orientia chuto str. Dubai TaxID=1359168 RepID=A0A0F3MPD2_9RICK|nr:hypothetical protein OCHUTO_0086 [Orientia chuto str. Dubai]